jgi:molecular chaperone GrpE
MPPDGGASRTEGEAVGAASHGGPQAETDGSVTGQDAESAAGQSATDDVMSAVEAGLAQAWRERDEALARADENWDRYLRAEAELENSRKRAQRVREEALSQQRRDLLGRMLGVMDNLERALSHAGDDSGPLREGIEATYRELARTLAAEGVERFDAMDEPFDPALHEAMAVVPMPGLDEERVIGVDAPGYLLDGVLLRPARVVVGKPVA